MASDFTLPPSTDSVIAARSKGLELSLSQENVLQCIALFFSTASVASSVLSFYWFLKMRRSFRHDLIMFLIQSDMFKALWFMLYPIVVFTRGPIPDASSFCQVNGFFLALGVEAADIAALMIAVHSALYIFKPRVSPGEGGLYPYRHHAYIIWVVFPFLMASLAFVNTGPAYVGSGTYCYLPIRPFWYRLALAWIPRYMIFIFILGLYASIYYYVRYKFHGFTEIARSNSSENDDITFQLGRPSKPTRTYHPDSLPPTPTLACHGLIPDFSPRESHERIPSASSSGSLKHPRPITSPTGTNRFIWSTLFSPNIPSLSSPPPELSEVDSDSFIGPSTPHPLPTFVLTTPLSAHSGQSYPESEAPSRSRDTSWQDAFVHRISSNANNSPISKRSVVDIFSILRHRPGDTVPQTPVSQIQLVNSRGQNLADVEMLRSREKIRRQLRFLFIYPLVYIGMWIIPFAVHAIQYDDKLATRLPFVLTCLKTIFISAQALVDCILFCTREKPWRHIPGTDGGFWSSLRFWSDWKGVSKRRVTKGPGKTREEMVRDSRAAYQRRDEELAQRRNQAGLGVSTTHQRRGSDWWEMDGSVDDMAEDESTHHLVTVDAEGSSPNSDAPLKEVRFLSPKTREEKREERAKGSGTSLEIPAAVESRE